ncbi:hypothetical protein H4R33_002284 [Dimargaris cristalligena]|uniref:Uncharacterized protein n=1 Tax=Dimargaris cristalligena TaxID=215637 RepID=A0A4Q0A4P6_9FUNG|nr:hypothetical protein H4R33_002284 [Dimargaris cristalligena]RKP40372.1 hypothetical protein BJ085DRAFT_30402 [Dimargaris cristalligena]|eukprot:RKP40372.1 hypothetical protein BJ085DRAFT_30402 [Dimargaris cristalligena]
MVPNKKWIVGDDIRIGYTRFQLLVHSAIILVSGFQYTLSLACDPLGYSIGTIPSLCLLFILLHHLGLLFVFRWSPVLYQPFILYYTPFAYGCLWIYTGFLATNDDSLPVLRPATAGSSALHFRWPPKFAPLAGGQEYSPSTPVHYEYSTQLPYTGFLNLDCPLPAQLQWLSSRWIAFALWWVLWVIRRNSFGVVMFQKASATPTRVKRMAYRLYCLICPCLVVLLWKWYPALLATWDNPRLDANEPIVALLLQKIHLSRPDYSCLFMAIVGVLAGMSHIMWYSFLSFSYCAVYWKSYLREGVAVWLSGPQAVAGKLC